MGPPDEINWGGGGKKTPTFSKDRAARVAQIKIIPSHEKLSMETSKKKGESPPSKLKPLPGWGEGGASKGEISRPQRTPTGGGNRGKGIPDRGRTQTGENETSSPEKMSGSGTVLKIRVGERSVWESTWAQGVKLFLVPLRETPARLAGRRTRQE